VLASGAQESIGMSYQAMAGWECAIFSAGCTMNTGSKKLQREAGSTFSGAQVTYLPSANLQAFLYF